MALGTDLAQRLGAKRLSDVAEHPWLALSEKADTPAATFSADVRAKKSSDKVQRVELLPAS